MRQSVIWHNSQTHETQIWFMEGERLQRRGTMLGEDGQAVFIGPPFSIVAAGDMDGDGKADIIWHNSETHETQIWFMDGERLQRRGTVLGEDGQAVFIGPPFSIVAAGDMDGDGKADIVWHNSETHETQIWFMDGERLRRRGTVLGEDGQAVFIGPPFSIVAAGDMDGDGKADIVWHNSETHETQIWFMDGERLRRRGTVLGEDGQAVFIGPPFSIVAAGDMDGDGKADIIWHNSETHEMQIWFMDGERLRRRGTVLGEDGQAVFIGPPFSIVAAGSVNHPVFQALQRNLIHQHYLSQGGRRGPFGFPVVAVQFSGPTATREYRGGTIQLLDNGSTVGFVKRQAAIRFLGFRCLRESNELSGHDEPYFVIAVDQGDGRPVTKKFGPFENTDAGTVRSVAELLIDRVAPDPTAIRVLAYENDEGDPDETARKLREKLVEISNEVASIAGASGADAADGAGVGVGSTAAGVGGVLAGPLGALAATGIVAALGLGDDFIGQSALLQFVQADQAKTPDKQGDFEGNAFNAKITVEGGDEGAHELFFDVRVADLPSPIPV